jgi:hypothetical protein
MKLKTVKKRFIKSRNKEFWKESLKTLKKMFWHAGEFNRTPAYMINFCDATNGVEGVER